MEKSKYEKPFLVVEKFEPQNYCVNCKTQDNRYYPGEEYYADFDSDGKCENNESVSRTWSGSGITDYANGKYLDVKIYQHQYNIGGWRPAGVAISDPVGHSYGVEWRPVYSPVNHRLALMETQTLIVENGNVYKNVS